MKAAKSCFTLGIASAAAILAAVVAWVISAATTPPMTAVSMELRIAMAGSWLTAALLGPVGFGFGLWCWLAQDAETLEPVKGRLLVGMHLAVLTSLTTHGAIAMLLMVVLRLAC